MKNSNRVEWNQLSHVQYIGRHKSFLGLRLDDWDSVRVTCLSCVRVEDRKGGSQRVGKILFCAP